MNEAILSHKSQEFLDNLRVYLFSSGKSADEIDEIVEELKAHLVEAEENGKPIEKIIGNSPKEYMEMVSQEMPFDYRSWMKYFFLIILGSFSFKIFTDLLKGSLSYSLLEIAGHIVIGTIFITSTLAGFKYLSTSHLSIKKQGLIFGAIGVLPITSFIGLIYLNKAIETPVIHFGHTGSLVIGVITAFLLIGLSIWAKSWTLIIIVALLTAPEYLLSLTSLSYETQLIMQPLITFGGIGIYLWVVNKAEKKYASS